MRDRLAKEIPNAWIANQYDNLSNTAAHYENIDGSAVIAVPARERWALRELVVLHEVAHAMCGKNAGHTKTWLNTAKSIGYRAEKFTGKEIASEFAPWVGFCPAGHEHFRYRKPTRQLACGLCGRSFSKANLIEWRSR